ncbi:unnamed protein product [Enterobius vermicularis]|uniref:UBX domain-containing protein n=1 Tax=Enterobius vermicularis TaxID=51028 RepID=A0A0N4V891_ENTVE|nr:unnamed protein product [Enterobius vermicularis]
MKLTCDRYVHCNGNSRCGTSLKGELEVTFHHGKTKHDIFSESSEQIKPLTKEEKEQKVMEMREKIRVAMARKQEKEEQEANEKERKRRLDGRATADMLERRRELEMKQAAEQRRRDKQEATEAKKRILEEIKRDREAFKDGQKSPASNVVPTQKPAPVKNTSSNTDHCNLQIRLPNGTTMKEKFKSTETLAAVRVWIEVNRQDPEEFHYPFALMVPFPHQTFTEDDMEKPLNALGNLFLMPHITLSSTNRFSGLVPSACLVVARAKSF